jgi:cyclic pyranopterin phosphate synthase
MPLDNGHQWDRKMLVGGREVLRRIEERHKLVSIDRDSPSETALKYGFADGAPGEIGIIAPVTRPLCGACSRLRLTADGNLLTCLFSMVDHNIREPLRRGDTRDQIAQFMIAQCSKKKRVTASMSLTLYSLRELCLSSGAKGKRISGRA